jgi:simple sugar transport system permease protein
LLIGLALLFIFWLFMKYTRWGLEMRAIGNNAQAARRNGIPLKKYLIIVMCAGGAIAGLAGMSQISGFYGVLLLNFSMSLGFMGFMVSWLAGGEPLGIVLMSFVISVIITGGNFLQLTRGVPYSVINLLLAFTLFVVLARPNLFRMKKS